MKASAGLSVGASLSTACATQAGETSRPMMRSPCVGLKPIDAHGVVRQPLPDRQQQAGDDVQVAVGELRHRGDLGLPGAGEVRPVHLLPMGLRDNRERDRGTLHRAEQADAPFDLAVVEHQARRRHLHGGASGLAVDQKLGAGIIRPFERLGEGERPVAVAAGDGEHLRLGPRRGWT